MAFFVAIAFEITCGQMGVCGHDYSHISGVKNLEKLIWGPIQDAKILSQDGVCVTFHKVTRSLCKRSKSLSKIIVCYETVGAAADFGAVY